MNAPLPETVNCPLSRADQAQMHSVLEHSTGSEIAVYSAVSRGLMVAHGYAVRTEADRVRLTPAGEALRVTLQRERMAFLSIARLQFDLHQHGCPFVLETGEFGCVVTIGNADHSLVFEGDSIVDVAEKLQTAEAQGEI